MDSFYIWHKWSLSLAGVSRVTFFWQIFKTFRPWPWKKKSTILDGFFPYLTQMITSMRRCVAYNDLCPWPISSRLFGLDLENRVLSVASTVLDGFFPYVVQMITSMRRCVACDDLWPWPISSRSFGLDLENRVLSVASTVLDGLFPYLVQMISSMRRCVACDDLWTWPISSRSFDLDFENSVRSVTFSVLDPLFFWLGIQYDSIMWVIMRRRGVSSERRRSSYSSCFNSFKFQEDSSIKTHTNTHKGYDFTLQYRWWASNFMLRYYAQSRIICCGWLKYIFAVSIS